MERVQRSNATSLREQGNLLYQQAVRDGCSIIDALGKTMDAARCYSEALASSTGNDERASCCKNLGVVHWKRAELLARDARGAHHAKLLAYHMENSVKGYLDAMKYGESGGKAADWLAKCKSALRGHILQDVPRLIYPLQFADKQHAAESICRVFDSTMGKSTPAAYIQLVLAKTLFQQGAKLLKDGVGEEMFNHRRCKFYMEECERPLREAESRAENEDTQILSEVADIRQLVFSHVSSCEALQAIDAGDKLVRHLLFDAEEVEFEKIWYAIDKYKEAYLLTKDGDVEIRAYAASRMGRVFGQVLRMEQPAQRYHLEGTTLARTVMSKRIEGAEWYKECSKAVESYELKMAREAEEQHRRLRAPVLASVKNELEEIAAHAVEGPSSFVDYLYRRHPPKSMIHRPTRLGSTKYDLMAAIIRYHPEKNTADGFQWQVMCEEISKHLNRMYQALEAQNAHY